MNIQPRTQKVLALWEKVLWELLKWPSTRVNNWAQEWVSEIEDPSGLFFHETELYYVSGLLISHRLRREDSVNTQRLREDIEVAIQGNTSTRFGESHFDWSAARQRVNLVLSEYGETLDAIGAELDERRIGIE